MLHQLWWQKHSWIMFGSVSGNGECADYLGAARSMNDSGSSHHNRGDISSDGAFIGSRTGSGAEAVEVLTPSSLSDS